jgi:5-methylcytosine-specific restriction endonuclease McrA
MSRVVPKHVARQVQARARFMCEYCKLPDWLAFADFEVDHVIAKAHRGNSELDNLAWSCLLCNVNKGPNLSSIDPDTGKVTILFHPRHNEWRNHFRLSEGLIIPRTASGRATVVC